MPEHLEHHCHSTGRNKPRMLTTHQATCPDPTTCCGCIPCPERHCQVCHHTHVTADTRGTDHTCTTCLHQARTDLATIWHHAAHLLGAAILAGLNSPAADLAGPVADVEAWGYRRMTAKYGPTGNRIAPDWLAQQIDILHPQWVLGTWELETRRHLDQTLSPGTSKPTLTEARDYLDGHLTWLAHDPDFAFGEMATDLADCRRHLERVLGLDEATETGVRCPACDTTDLVKQYDPGETIGYTCVNCDHDVDTTSHATACPTCDTPAAPRPRISSTAKLDRWTCPHCRAWWTDTAYRLRVGADYLEYADRLTASQIAEQHGIPEGTVRRLANGWTTGKGATYTEHPAVVRKHGYDGQHRQLYDVDDILAYRGRTNPGAA